MKRADLMRAIARGICADKSLSKKEQRALCVVGLTAEKVRVGSYGLDKDIGCPLTQAGIYTRNAENSHLAFAQAFDGETDVPHVFGGVVVEIEDD